MPKHAQVAPNVRPFPNALNPQVVALDQLINDMDAFANAAYTEHPDLFGDGKFQALIDNALTCRNDLAETAPVRGVAQQDALDEATQAMQGVINLLAGSEHRPMAQLWPIQLQLTLQPIQNKLLQAGGRRD